MTAVLDDMAVGEARAIGRRRPDRRHEGYAHLAAMCVAGDGERDARRHFGENIGLVREQDNGIVAGDARERAGKIVFAADAARPEPVRELVVEPGQPKALVRRGDMHDAVCNSGMPTVRNALRTPSMSYHQS